MYFILAESEPLPVVMAALRRNGAVEAQAGVTVTIDGRQWGALNVTTVDEYAMRRLVALCKDLMDADEQDPRVIGAGLARAGEWMLSNIRPGS